MSSAASRAWLVPVAIIASSEDLVVHFVARPSVVAAIGVDVERAVAIAVDTDEELRLVSWSGIEALPMASVLDAGVDHGFTLRFGAPSSEPNRIELRNCCLIVAGEASWWSLPAVSLAELERAADYGESRRQSRGPDSSSSDASH